MALFSLKKKNKKFQTTAKRDRSSDFVGLEKQTKKPNFKLDPEKSKNPEILDINLIQEEGDRFFDWNQNIAKLLFFVFLALFVAIEVYIALSWVETRHLSQTDFFAQDFQNLNNEIREAREEAIEAEQFQERLELVGSILDRHVYWTNFFNFLEKNTLDTVYYSDFKGTIEGNYELMANAKNYDDITDQVNDFLELEDVNEVRVDSGSLVSSADEQAEDFRREVSFRINLGIDPNLFLK